MDQRTIFSKFSFENVFFPFAQRFDVFFQKIIQIQGWRKQFRNGVSMATVQQLLISQMGASPTELIEAIKHVSQDEAKVQSNDGESLYC